MIPTRVVKVGGSLLLWESLPSALSKWLADQDPMQNVLIAGGGPFADLVRAADRRFNLGEKPSHWICIDLLRATSRLLATLLPEARHVCDWGELVRQLETLELAEWFVLDAVQFLYEIEPTTPGEPLTQTWAVTSDTIAARIAQSLAATELVLLKSTSMDDTCDLASLAASGIVDQAFQRAAGRIPQIRIVDLRNCRQD